MKPRRWIWVVLFVAVIAVMVSLATGWNVVLYIDYLRLLEAARALEPSMMKPALPWIAITLGTLGFGAALGALVLFFVRLLREMRLTQLQSEFLQTVSHELKTPIAAAELSASLIRAGGISDEEVARLWEAHDAELGRLHGQVEALLKASRPEKLQKRERAAVRLESWLETSMERWRRLLGPSGSLRREGAPLESDAWIDPGSLDLIADNLIDNARKFSKGPPTVTVRTERVGGGRRARWRISFVDEGWGFDPSESRRIFSRFFRGKTAAPYAIPGTGLGLYLAATASQSMGVSLRAESRGRGHGAVFTLEGKFR
jgi:signal transduction histidine kinase